MSWRRIWLLSSLLVVVFGTATWVLLQRSDAATAIVRRELASRFRAPTYVGSTALDLGRGRLVASDLRLDDPARPGTALIAADRVDVDVGLLTADAIVGVHAVAIQGFAIDLGDTLPTAPALLAGGDGPPGRPRVPPITATGGRIRASLRRGEPPVELADVEFTAAQRPGSDLLTLRAGCTVAETGWRLAIGGGFDLATGAGTLHVDLAEARLDEAIAARIGALLAAALPAFTGGATVQALRATAAFGAGQPPRVTVQARLSHLRLRAAELPALLNDATVDLDASTDDDGTAALRLEQRTPGAALSLLAHGSGLFAAQRLQVRARGEEVAIDAEVVRALQLFDAGRDVVAALQPTTGRADFDLFVRDGAGIPSEVELDLRLRDLALTYAGFGDPDDRTAFPLPLERTSGRVRLRDDVVRLDDVEAHVVDRAGGGVVRLRGRVDTNRPAGEDVALDIDAENVAFSPDLRAALGALLDDGGALYDRLAPTGRATVAVRLRPRSELPGGWTAAVRPQGGSMRWAGFPYELQDLRGEVSARASAVAFDLTGVRGPGRLSMRGRIPLADGGDDAFFATVALADVALDDALRQAVAVLAPDLDQPWRDSAPRGRIGGEVRVWRQRPDAPLCHDARLDFSAVALDLPAAPWRATDLHGRVQVQGDGEHVRIDFDGLRGRLEHGRGTPAPMSMLGHLTLGQRAGEDLVFAVRDLELDDQLGSTLEALDALGPGTWHALRPSGTVDLVCHHRRRGSSAEPLRVAVRLLDVRSDAAILPRPAEHMTGELRIANEELTFASVQALLGGAMVRCSDGRVRVRPDPDARTEIAFTVDAQGIPVDDGIANLFADPLHSSILQRRLSGRADLDGVRLQLAIPASGDALPFETMVGGQIRLYDVSMTLGYGADAVVVDRMNGVAAVAESRIDREGGQLRGALRGVSFRLFGQSFEQADALFVADVDRITATMLNARCHGGVVQSARPDGPAVEYLLPGLEAPTGRLSADLAFEQVDVYTFLAQNGWQNPPYSGAASGKVRIDALDGSNVLEARGAGSLRIERADLGVVPLFTAIYAQLPPADRPRFDRLETTWTVADRGVRFDTFDVRSSILAARGKGRLGFDGYLEMELTLDKLLGSTADPFVMPLIDYLAQNIVTFWLHGYLRDLRAEKRWFSGARPARRQVLPLPPVTAARPAPPF